MDRPLGANWDFIAFYMILYVFYFYFKSYFILDPILFYLSIYRYIYIYISYLILDDLDSSE